MSNELYRQCILHRGDARQISWLPEQYAVAGGHVKLKDGKGVWDDGWKVHEVYAPTRTLEEVRERSQDYKKTRKASDV